MINEIKKDTQARMHKSVESLQHLLLNSHRFVLTPVFWIQ